jgi:hypothetical protein
MRRSRKKEKEKEFVVAGSRAVRQKGKKQIFRFANRDRCDAS